jgi:hypothetical protein
MLLEVFVFNYLYILNIFLFVERSHGRLAQRSGLRPPRSRD